MSKVLIVQNNDKRMVQVAEELVKKNDVKIIKDELSLFYEISGKAFDSLVLPIRGINSEAVIDGTDIVLSDNYFRLISGKTLFTGQVSEFLKQKCRENNIQFISYFSDDVEIKNNYLTTEGAVEALVNHSEKAIFNSKLLITGYGKLGQILAKVLSVMKADVTVCARNDKDLLHAKITDLQVLRFQELFNHIHEFDFVINTVPARIIDNTMLTKLKTGTLVIDLASYPYGLDHEYALKNNIHALLLPGIPGKKAPVTAGKIIGDYINEALSGGETDE